MEGIQNGRRRNCLIGAEETGVEGNTREEKHINHGIAEEGTR